MKAILEEYFNSRHQSWFKDFARFLSFESISLDPQKTSEMTACAGWLCAYLAPLGFKSQVINTQHLPVFFAELSVDPAAKTILYYGHYDVQPPGEEHAWQSPPFEADLRDGTIYARGAADNKGQTFYFLKALEYLISTASLRHNVKIVLEGEEEKNSDGLIELLHSRPELFSADMLLVCDSAHDPSGAPAIIAGLRGMADCRVQVKGSKRELHSGYFGGISPNPAIHLSKAISALFDRDGHVSLENFCDEGDQPGRELRELVNSSAQARAEIEQFTGVALSAPEKGWTYAEQCSLRPSIEVHGLYSGYTGPGCKTIIPTEAIAIISLRTVAGQNPEHSLNKVIDALKAEIPENLQFEVLERNIGGYALALGPNSPGIILARRALKEVELLEPRIKYNGSSIPIIPALKEVAGAEACLVGFSNQHNNIHGVNENFSWAQMKRGFLFVCSLFLTYGTQPET